LLLKLLAVGIVLPTKKLRVLALLRASLQKIPIPPITTWYCDNNTTPVEFQIGFFCDFTSSLATALMHATWLYY
jgi:hypothetical protein